MAGGSQACTQKTVVVGALRRDNNGAVYVFTLQGETWTEDKILTASDMALGDEFGWSVA